MHGVKQLTRLQIPFSLLEDSIRSFKASPYKEKVVLWLGNKNNGLYVVQEVFTPIQITEADYFHIPKEGMSQLMEKLKSSRKMLVAQVHTHPSEAFHSLADDEWAIVRHLGSYSLVIPSFCSLTSAHNFKQHVASFVLSNTNMWEQVDNYNIIIT